MDNKKTSFLILVVAGLCVVCLVFLWGKESGDARGREVLRGGAVISAPHKVKTGPAVLSAVVFFEEGDLDCTHGWGIVQSEGAPVVFPSEMVEGCLPAPSIVFRMRKEDDLNWNWKWEWYKLTSQ